MWLKTQTGDLVNLALASRIVARCKDDNSYLVQAVGSDAVTIANVATRADAIDLIDEIESGLINAAVSMDVVPLLS
jgi:phage tail sheath protein FI